MSQETFGARIVWIELLHPSQRCQRLRAATMPGMEHGEFVVDIREIRLGLRDAAQLLHREISQTRELVRDGQVIAGRRVVGM